MKLRQEGIPRGTWERGKSYAGAGSQGTREKASRMAREPGRFAGEAGVAGQASRLPGEAMRFSDEAMRWHLPPRRVRARSFGWPARRLGWRVQPSRGRANGMGALSKRTVLFSKRMPSCHHPCGPRAKSLMVCFNRLKKTWPWRVPRFFAQRAGGDFNQGGRWCDRVWDRVSRRRRPRVFSHKPWVGAALPCAHFPGGAEGGWRLRAGCWHGMG